MLRRRVTKTLRTLQDGYRLVRPGAGYYFAVLLGRVGRSRLADLARRYDVHRNDKQRRARADVPNFTLLATDPAVVLTNATSANNPWLRRELTLLRLRGLDPRLVDLRSAHVRIGPYVICASRNPTTGRLGFRVRPANSEVIRAAQRLRQIARTCRDPEAFVKPAERVLRYFAERFRWVNAREEFRRVQHAADDLMVRLLARHQRATKLSHVRKRCVHRVYLRRIHKDKKRFRPCAIFYRRRRNLFTLLAVRLLRVHRDGPRRRREVSEVKVSKAPEKRTSVEIGTATLSGAALISPSHAEALAPVDLSAGTIASPSAVTAPSMVCEVASQESYDRPPQSRDETASTAHEWRSGSDAGDLHREGRVQKDLGEPAYDVRERTAIVSPPVARDLERAAGLGLRASLGSEARRITAPESVSTPSSRPPHTAADQLAEGGEGISVSYPSRGPRCTTPSAGDALRDAPQPTRPGSGSGPIPPRTVSHTCDLSALAIGGAGGGQTAYVPHACEEGPPSSVLQTAATGGVLSGTGLSRGGLPTRGESGVPRAQGGKTPRPEVAARRESLPGHEPGARNGASRVLGRVPAGRVTVVRIRGSAGPKGPDGTSVASFADQTTAAEHSSVPLVGTRSSRFEDANVAFGSLSICPQSRPVEPDKGLLRRLWGSVFRFFFEEVPG